MTEAEQAVLLILAFAGCVVLACLIIIFRNRH